MACLLLLLTCHSCRPASPLQCSCSTRCITVQVLDGIASFDFSPASIAAADAAVLRQHPGANSSGPHGQQPYSMAPNHQDAGPLLGGGGGSYSQAPGYQTQSHPDMHGMKRKHEPAGSFGAPLDDVFKRRRQRGMRTPPDS